MDKQLVNDYYIDENNITFMAQSDTLFNACLAKKPQLTMKEFRQNLDTAERILKAYQHNKSKKQNTAKELEENIDYGDVCPDCGGPIKRSGTCWVCYAGCGNSVGGCS